MDDDVQNAAPFTKDELESARQFAVVIQWSSEDDAYIAEIPQLRGAVTHGATLAEAADMAVEAAALWIRMAQSTGETIPAPRHLLLTA